MWFSDEDNASPLKRKGCDACFLSESGKRKRGKLSYLSNFEVWLLEECGEKGGDFV